MHDYEITNPGNIVNGQLLRRKMAHLTQQLGVVAQSQPSGTTDSVNSTLTMLAGFQSHMLNVKGAVPAVYPTALLPAKPAAPVDGLWQLPSILYNQAGAAVRELLIRAGQQAVYDAEVSSGDTANLLFRMTEDVAKELSKLAPAPAVLATKTRAKPAKAPVELAEELDEPEAAEPVEEPVEEDADEAVDA